MPHLCSRARLWRALRFEFWILPLFSLWFAASRFKNTITPNEIIGFIQGNGGMPFQSRYLVTGTFGNLFLWVLDKPDAAMLHLCFGVTDAAWLLAALIVFRRMMATFTSDRRTIDIATIIFCAAAVYHYSYFQHILVYNPYDIPHLFFSACILYAIRIRNWPLLFVALALGTLNRETVVVYLPLILFASPDGGRREVRIFVAACLLWLVCKAGVMLYFAGNPGTSLQFYSAQFRGYRIVRNVLLLGTPKVLMLVGVGAFSLLYIVLHHRDLRDRFLRRMFIVYPLSLVPLSVVGNLDEVRVYGDLIPVMAAQGSMLVAARWLGEARAASLPAAAPEQAPEPPGRRILRASG